MKEQNITVYFSKTKTEIRCNIIFVDEKLIQYYNKA